LVTSRLCLPGIGLWLSQPSEVFKVHAIAALSAGAPERMAYSVELNAKRTDGQPLGTVLRFAAIYGSRIKGNYQRLVQALARRRFILIGDGRNRRTLIYDRDVARAALLAVQHPNAAGKVYNVSDGQFHTLKEIIVAICQALGRTPPRFSVPVGPARFMAGLMEDTFQLLGRKSPIGRDTIDKYTEDIAVDSRLIQRELGFRPQFDLKTGWEETIRKMQGPIKESFKL
jgi:UDP-glucose 4-epimerase